MADYVYVVQREEYDKTDLGEPIREIINVYASEETADKICKEKATEEASGYNPPFAVKKNDSGYGYFDDYGFVSYFYTKYEIKGE